MTIETFSEYCRSIPEISGRYVEIVRISGRMIILSETAMIIMKGGVRDIDRHIGKMKSDVRALRSGRADESDGIQMLEDTSAATGRIVDVKQRLAELDEEQIALLEREIVLLKEIFDLYGDQIDYYQRDIENFIKKISDYEETIKKYGIKLMDSKIRFAEAKKSGNKTRMDFEKKRINAIKTVISSAKEGIGSAKRVIRSHRKCLRMTIRCRDDLTGWIDRDTAELEGLRNSRDGYGKSIARSKADIKRIEGLISDLKANASEEERVASGR